MKCTVSCRRALRYIKRFLTLSIKGIMRALCHIVGYSVVSKLSEPIISAIILLCLGAMSTRAAASITLSPVLTNASLTFERFLPNGRMYLLNLGLAPTPSLMTPTGPQWRLMGSMRLQTLHVTYLELTVTGVADSTQFRYVGLAGQVGIQLTPWLSVFYNHLSEHSLDRSGPEMFPVQDSLGIRLDLLGPTKAQPLLNWR